MRCDWIETNEGVQVRRFVINGTAYVAQITHLEFETEGFIAFESNSGSAGRKVWPLRMTGGDPNRRLDEMLNSADATIRMMELGHPVSLPGRDMLPVTVGVALLAGLAMLLTFFFLALGGAK